MATGRDEAAARTRVRLLVSSLGLAAIASLVVLHASILWERLVNGRMGEPGVALRWLAAGVLVAALVALRRRGVSLLWGRRALVFWLLVLLLHAGAAVPQEEAARVVPEQLLVVVPAALAPACLLLLLVSAHLGRGRPADPRRACLAHAAGGDPRATRSGFLLAIPPRAPPA
jgi:hypothetical protein